MPVAPVVPKLVVLKPATLGSSSSASGLIWVDDFSQMYGCYDQRRGRFGGAILIAVGRRGGVMVLSIWYNVGAMRVYSLDTMFASRDSVWFEPFPDVVMAVEYEGAEFWQDEIWRYVLNYFYGRTYIFEFSRDMGFLWIYREFLKFKYISGFSSDVALLGAKNNFANMMVKRAGGIGWVAIGLVAAMAAMGLVFAVADWTESDSGHLNFPVGACLFRYEERLWWGGLVGHPTELEWDFQLCGPLGDMFWYEHRVMGDGYNHWDVWHCPVPWEIKQKKTIGWNVYRVDQVQGRFLGVAHNLGFGRYRLPVGAMQEPPFDRPWPWGIREFYACEYLSDFASFFVG